MHEIAEVIREGLSIFYGPPGSGKTSVTLRLIDRFANRVLWISTTESPKFLKEAAARVGANAEKFNFLDFPRAFREDIIKYILDHARYYDALVIDSINGISHSIPNLEKLAHSVLYQISQTRPVVLISEEEPTKLHYIADHVVHVWYRKNSLGHIIRYAQLEKSRTHPPSPRYIFEILEDGIVYLDIKDENTDQEVIYDEKLGQYVYTKGEICVQSNSVEKVAALFEKIGEDAFFVKIGPWITYKAPPIEKRRVVTVKTFQDLFRAYSQLRNNGKTRYVVISGLLNLKDEEIPEYILIAGSFLQLVQNIIFVGIGSEEDIKKLKKYCLQTIEL